MILYFDLMLLLWVLRLWWHVEQKWRTVYISHDPPTHWNCLQVDGIADNIEIQAALDFLDKRRGGMMRLGSGRYWADDTITLPRKNIIVCGEQRNEI